MRENFYKLILDNVHDGVYFVDRERRITYWNKGAERITGYSSADMVGKRCFDDILKHVNEKGVKLCRVACPLVEAMSSGQTREDHVFLHHRDGHRLPVHVRAVPVRDEGGSVLGAVELFSDASKTLADVKRIEVLSEMSLLDSLTKIGNRRYLEINLMSRFEEFKRYDWPFGLIFLDVDDFKKVNDQWGHEVGDEVLFMTAATLINNVRSFDVIGRWGGEEFLIILVNVGQGEVGKVANKLRVLIEKSGLYMGEDIIEVTVSIGATMARPGDDVEGLMKRVDRLLYQSKEKGKNRVTADWD